MATTTITRNPTADEQLLQVDPNFVPPYESGEEQAPDAEALIKEARRRQHRRWAVIALVLVVVGGLVTGVAAGSGAPPPRPPHAQDVNAPQAPPSASLALPWASQIVASTPDARSIVAGTGRLYWLTGPDPALCRGGSTTVPVTYDLKTGAKYRGAPLPACTQAIAVAGGSLLALERTGSSLVVASLDTKTLAVTRTTTLPLTAVNPECALQACAAMAAGPGPALWVSNGGEVWRLDPASGAVEASFEPRSVAAALAPAPTGAILYTSGANPTSGGAVIDEYAVPSGILRGRAIFNQCVQTGPAQLAAGPSGVWVSCRTGMAGSATALSSNGLAVVPKAPTPTGSNGPFFHMMGVTVETSGGPLWLSSIGDLACANPATGTLLAKESLPVPLVFGSHVAVGNRFYGELPNSGVVSVDPPATCFAG